MQCLLLLSFCALVCVLWKLLRRCHIKFSALITLIKFQYDDATRHVSRKMRGVYCGLVAVVGTFSVMRARAILFLLFIDSGAHVDLWTAV
jgi:hypothetical protein